MCVVVCFRIRFTLVSEPPEDDQDGDCEDVGVAFVNIRDILTRRKDVNEQDIPSTSQTFLHTNLFTQTCVNSL